jgi:hypothetical protein
MFFARLNQLDGESRRLCHTAPSSAGYFLGDLCDGKCNFDLATHCDIFSFKKKLLIALGVITVIFISFVILNSFSGGDRIISCYTDLAAAALAIEESERYVQKVSADMPWDRCTAYRAHVSVLEKQKPIMFKCANIKTAYFSRLEAHYDHLIAEACR